MKIIKSLTALAAGCFFLINSGFSQGKDPIREVAEVKTQCSYSVHDNYKDQFRDRKVGKFHSVWHDETVTSKANYKHQAGRTREIQRAASVDTETGVVRGENYKHQVGS